MDVVLQPAPIGWYGVVCTQRSTDVPIQDKLVVLEGNRQTRNALTYDLTTAVNA